MGKKVKYEPAIEPNPNPCLTCRAHGANPQKVAPMDMRIAVGFGSAFLSKNGKEVWDEQRVKDGDWDKMLTVAQAEKMARRDPDADWRIHKHGPLHGEVYQRQGKDNWVCIEQDNGFA
jgi:hypothetical protein